MASIIAPLRMSCVATPRPTSRGRRCVPPKPGRMPSLTSGCPNRARSDATRMWQASASSQPPPRAKPFTAATIGFWSRSKREKTAWPRVQKRRPADGSRREISSMSAPATKARPAPVTITASISSESWIFVTASSSSSTSEADSAFRLSGRFSRTVAIERSTLSSRSAISSLRFPDSTLLARNVAHLGARGLLDFERRARRDGRRREQQASQGYSRLVLVR